MQIFHTIILPPHWSCPLYFPRIAHAQKYDLKNNTNISYNKDSRAFLPSLHSGNCPHFHHGDWSTSTSYYWTTNQEILASSFLDLVPLWRGLYWHCLLGLRTSIEVWWLTYFGLGGNMSRVHPPHPQSYYSWLSSLPLLGIVLQPMCAVLFSRYWLLSFTKNHAKEISDIEDVSTDWFPASGQTLSTASDSRIPYTTNRPASVLPTALAQNPPLRTKLGDTPSTAAIPMWTVHSPSSTFS